MVGSRGTCSSPKAILAARRAQGRGLSMMMMREGTLVRIQRPEVTYMCCLMLLTILAIMARDGLVRLRLSQRERTLVMMFYVGWYGTGICLKNPTQPGAAHATKCMAREVDLKNPTRVWHGNFIITKRRKPRPRERCLSAGARPSNLVDVFFKNRC